MRTKALRLVLVLSLGSLTSGCYLTHLASGQWRLLSARESIAALLAAPETPEPLRSQLARVQEVRSFAAELGLAVGDAYTSYVPWPGDRIVTSVVAAEPGRIEPATFWFPIVGRVPYRGYFDRERAEAEADRLRDAGYDVCIGPVRAYSTLGWFDDPVTAPMLTAGEGELVETLLHELVHATAFVASQPDFNEGIATFIGEEASVAFYTAGGDAEAAARRRAAVEERRAISGAVLGLREAVAELYAAEPAGEVRASRRQELEREARVRLGALPLAVHDAARVAEYARLNDACLALSATYTADLTAYVAALGRSPGLAAFVEALSEASAADDPRALLLGL